MAYDILECPYCGLQRPTVRPPSITFLPDDAPISDGPRVTRAICSQPSCRWRQLRQQARDALARDQVLLQSELPPSTGVLRPELFGDAFLYRGAGWDTPPPYRHQPHARLIWPPDRELMRELDYWQQHDGWTPPPPTT